MKIGISRYPDYYDMFYIETDAPITFVKKYIQDNANDDYRSLTRLIKEFRDDGFSVIVVNMDYILDDNLTFITKTNELRNDEK